MKNPCQRFRSCNDGHVRKKKSPSCDSGVCARHNKSDFCAIKEQGQVSPPFYGLLSLFKHHQRCKHNFIRTVFVALISQSGSASGGFDIFQVVSHIVHIGFDCEPCFRPPTGPVVLPVWSQMSTFLCGHAPLCVNTRVVVWIKRQESRHVQLFS